MDNRKQLTTPTVDLLAPVDRFASASRLFGGLHRWRLLIGRYGWVIGLSLLLVNVLVFLATLLSSTGYQSKARMWLTGRLDIRENRLYTEEVIDYLGTQAELLRSPAIHERALARLSGQPGPGSNAESFRISSGADAPFPFKVKVREASRSSTLELQAVGAEADATRAFLNCLMEEYLEFKKAARETTSDRTSSSLATDMTQLKRELVAQQEKLHAFQSSNNVVFLQEQGNSAQSHLGALNKQLAALRTQLSLLKTLQPEQLAAMRSSQPGEDPDEASPGENMAKEMLANLAEPQRDLFKANQQMELLKARRSELSRFLRPLHPKIAKLNEEIATQEKLVQISRDEALKQLDHRRQGLELQVRNLEAASKEWEVRTLEASRKMADYDRLRQELQSLQSAYDKRLALIQTVDVSKTVEQENVGILEPASVAKPLNRMARNLAISLAGSLLLAFGVLYCFALVHDDFSSIAELGNQLSEEVVGQIPAISIEQPAGLLGLDGLEKKRFEFVESFRNIRSSLLFMNNGGPKPRTIVIASSVPEEGKSTVALYLAATMAMGNTRVLLVDADMRRGTLHECFGAASSPGLAEVLSRECSSARAIIRTGLNNLSILPAGKPKQNPGELVLSSEWSRFLVEAKEQFDYVLVDTPPVLATNDVAALATKVDGVLFVVRASFTSARMARGALDVLRCRHAKVLGLILNRAVSSAYEQYGYQRYQDSYGWRPQPARHAARLGSSVAENRNGG